MADVPVFGGFPWPPVLGPGQAGAPAVLAVHHMVRSQPEAGCGLASTVVVLPVFWSVGQLRSWWSPPLDAVVFVTLAVALPRAVAPLGTGDLTAAVAALLPGAAAGKAVRATGTSNGVLGEVAASARPDGHLPRTRRRPSASS